MELMEEGKFGPPAANNSRCSIVKSEQEQRRASAGMIERFESCHIGPDEDIPIPARTGSLPAIVEHAKRISILKSASPDPSDSPSQTVLPNTACQTLPQNPGLQAMWEESPRASPGKAWRPICFDGNLAKRQRRDEPTEIFATNSTNSSQFPQVSPKTGLSAISSSFRQSSYTPGYMDMLGSSSMEDMRGLTFPKHGMDTSWQRFGCRPPMNIDQPHNRLHCYSGTMFPDSSSPSKTISSTAPCLPPQSSDTTSSQNPRSNMQSEWEISPTCIPHSPNGYSGDVPLSSFPKFWERQQQTSVVPQSQSLLQSDPSTRSNIHLSSNRLPISKDPSYFWRTPRPSYLNEPRVAGRNMLHNSLTRPADILRKPSLYKIPPWTSTSDTSPSDVAARKGSNSNRRCADGSSGLISEQRSRSGFVTAPTSRPFGPTQARQVENRHEEATVAMASNGHEEQSLKIPSAEVFDPNASRKRGRHEHSPNL